MAAKNVESLVLVSNSNGIVVIPAKSPLTRLNYFDGKFLRASDLKAEQDYLRQLVRLSNQAGGSGVVHGFDLTLGGGDTLDLGPGLGINPDGRVVLLPQEVSLSIQELIERSQELQKFHKQANKAATEVFGDCVMAGDAPPVNTTHPSDLYLIVISPAEALCGEEDVYGKLCEEACATSTDRPYAVEGVIVRAVPLVLQTPLPHSKAVSTSKLHLRSRVASAYFEDERQVVDSMISKFGLQQQVWCLGADAATGNGLPLGVIARAGATTVFLDPWIPRRERMDTPPRRYWQWRMMMRPWDVFLAQILQFQCQLRDIFDGGFTPGQDDPCGDARTVIGEAAKRIADFIKVQKEMTPQFVATTDGVSREDVFKAKLIDLESVSQKLTDTEQQMKVTLGNRLLIRSGILELPSAGYLPVAPDAKMTVNEQVKQMMGEGVDLRFCVVRPDFVAHALEEAQHMERISLIQGLEDPKNKPQVDILIPDGEFVGAPAPARVGFAVEAKLQASVSAGNANNEETKTTTRDVPFKGVARAETLPSGGTAFYLACSSSAVFSQFSVGLDEQKLREAATFATSASSSTGPTLGMWLTLQSEHNLLLLKPGDKTKVSGEVVLATSPDNLSQQEFRGEINGVLTTRAPKQQQFPVEGTIPANFSFEGVAFPVKSGTKDFNFVAKPQGVGIQIGLASTHVNFGILADWSNPDKVQANIKSDIALSERLVAEMDLASSLTNDENIFKLTDPNHVLATKALEFIAAALKNPGFVAEKSDLLFPPDSENGSGGTIRATRDWVLFHRRRNKDCKAEVQAPPPVRTVCHTAFRARSVESFQSVLRAIESIVQAGKGDLRVVVVRQGLINIGDVLFEEHSAKVAGDGKTLSDVVTAWNTAGGGLSSGAIVCSQPSPQDQESRTNQATAMVQKINNGGVAPLRAITIPAGVSLPTACPAFTIIAPARVAVETTCVTVIQVFSRNNITSIRNAIATGDPSMINTVLAGQFGPNLGVVNFKKGTTEVVDKSLDKLKASIDPANTGQTEVLDSFVVTDTSATAAEKTAFQDQTAFLRQTFGGTQTQVPQLLTTKLPPEVGCPALVFLVIPPVVG
jgi:hypothetical protein